MGGLLRLAMRVELFAKAAQMGFLGFGVVWKGEGVKKSV